MMLVCTAQLYFVSKCIHSSFGSFVGLSVFVFFSFLPSISYPVLSFSLRQVSFKLSSASPEVSQMSWLDTTPPFDSMRPEHSEEKDELELEEEEGESTLSVSLSSEVTGHAKTHAALGSELEVGQLVEDMSSNLKTSLSHSNSLQVRGFPLLVVLGCGSIAESSPYTRKRSVKRSVYKLVLHISKESQYSLENIFYSALSLSL